MTKRISSLLLLSVFVLSSAAWGQEPTAEPTIKQRVLRIAASEKPIADPIAMHPLMPVLKYAYKRLDALDSEIQDFTCTLVKRERVDGYLTDYQYLDLKVRSREVRDNGEVDPLSVYAVFQAPSSVKGREILYIEDQNDGKILVRRGGSRLSFVTTSIDPNGPLAMKDNRYPITEVGFRNLVARLIERAEADLRFDECKVEYFKGAKIGDRECTHIVVTHPTQREHFTFYRAEIFIDRELNLPVRYVSYGWPTKEGSPLLEEYTYTNIELNVGLSEDDFNADNPDYGFYTRDEEAN